MIKANFRHEGFWTVLTHKSKKLLSWHISNIYNREDYRKKSITSEGVNGLICGFGSLSYILAIEALSKMIYTK